MRGLNRTHLVEAITTVKAINAAWLRDPLLWLLLFGSALVAGSVFTILRTVTTVLSNAPLNIRVAGVDPGELWDAAHEWRNLMVPWTWWNHLGTIGPPIGSVLFVNGLLSR